MCMFRIEALLSDLIMVFKQELVQGYFCYVLQAGIKLPGAIVFN